MIMIFFIMVIGGDIVVKLYIVDVKEPIIVII